MKHLSLAVAFLCTALLFSCSKKEDDLPKTSPEFELNVPTKLFRGTVKLSISSAELNSGDIGKVEYFFGETSIGEVTQSPFELDFNTENTPDGKYRLKVIVTRKSDASLSSVKMEEVEIDNILYTVNTTSNYMSLAVGKNEMWIYLTDNNGAVLGTKQIDKMGIYKFKAPKDFEGQIVNVTTGIFDPNGMLCNIVTDPDIKNRDSVSYDAAAKIAGANNTGVMNITINNAPFNLHFSPTLAPNIYHTGYGQQYGGAYRIRIEYNYKGDLNSILKVDATGTNQVLVGYTYLDLNTLSNTENITLDYNNFISIEKEGYRIQLPTSIEPLEISGMEFNAPFGPLNCLSIYRTGLMSDFIKDGYLRLNWKNDPQKKYATFLGYKNKSEEDNIQYLYSYFGQLPENFITTSLNLVSKSLDKNKLKLKLSQKVDKLSVYLVDAVDNNKTITWIVNSDNSDNIDFVLSIPKEIVDRFPVYHLSNIDYRIRTVECKTLMGSVSFGNKDYTNNLNKIFSFYNSKDPIIK